MRTTLTLDDDVASRLQAEARRSGRPFKVVVNECLRAALAQRKALKALPIFRVEPRDMSGATTAVRRIMRFCRAWFDAELNSDEIIALPWQTLLAFVRIATNPRIVRQPHIRTYPYHMPPRATVIASPFTPPAASLHRNAITCATSRGSRTRF